MLKLEIEYSLLSSIYSLWSEETRASERYSLAPGPHPRSSQVSRSRRGRTPALRNWISFGGIARDEDSSSGFKDSHSYRTTGSYFLHYRWLLESNVRTGYA